MDNTSGGLSSLERRTLGGGCHPTRPSISWMEETPVGLPDSVQSHYSSNESLRFTRPVSSPNLTGRANVDYSSLRRKTRDSLPGDIPSHPQGVRGQLPHAVPLTFNLGLCRDTYGTRTRPSERNTSGEGIWGCRKRMT
jgi:hypothetical protein